MDYYRHFVTGTHVRAIELIPVLMEKQLPIRIGEEGVIDNSHLDPDGKLIAVTFFRFGLSITIWCKPQSLELIR